ncbi:MAG: hypothetical protein PHD73_06820 [Sediminibacterium sp.]|nr:hypothetical protein [Sediminibacterium sp.]
MQRINKHIIAVFILFTGFSSCKKELSNNATLNMANALNDTTWTRMLPANAPVKALFDSISPKTSTANFTNEYGGTLHFGGNVDLIFQPGSFVAQNGAAVTGNVKIELIKILTKGEMVKAMHSTLYNNNLLESAGAFFIKAFQNEQELVLAPDVAYQIQYIDPDNDPKTSMQVYHGKEGIPAPAGVDPEFTWIKTTDGSLVRSFVRSGQGGQDKEGYEILSRKLNWICAAKLAYYNSGTSHLTAILPLNFTNKNTVVFAVFDEYKTIVPLYSDFAIRAFRAPNLPRQQKMTLISITKINKDFYYDEKDISDIGATGIFKLRPEKKSLEDILEHLSSL